MRDMLRLIHCAVLPLELAACGGPQSPPSSQTGQAQAQAPPQSAGPIGPPLATRNMPSIVGQQKTCEGAHEKIFDVDVGRNQWRRIGHGHDVRGLGVQRPSAGTDD